MWLNAGDGTGTRTRIVSLKGWCPDLLDDTAIWLASIRDYWFNGASELQLASRSKHPVRHFRRGLTYDRRPRLAPIKAGVCWKPHLGLLVSHWETLCMMRAETHDFWLALATGYLPRVVKTVVALPEPSLTIYIISYFL